MTEREKKLLADREERRTGETEFYELFPLEQYTEINYITNEIDKAITEKDSVAIDLLTYLLLYHLPSGIEYTNLLNKLLITRYHHKHQEVARRLQELKNPSSIPYVRRALASGFDYLTYTCSETGAIAKWFSWILAEISTQEAIEVLEEYSHSSDEGIKNEMLYRLKRIVK